ncbi:uncharacterized protein [Zea mays]|uniref:uncharacterized protein n=1 Tax=Zea mays TaxID=4577 RepID=UPI0004DE80DD|nr:uncharacterized protein LOC103644008 [Zea mays]|eukprot:XP_008665419.1 uncharacterized protein LOC103644008 [Zea mays]
MRATGHSHPLPPDNILFPSVTIRSSSPIVAFRRGAAKATLVRDGSCPVLLRRELRAPYLLCRLPSLSCSCSLSASGLQLVSELYSTKWWRSARRSNDDAHGWLEQASQATMADGGPREDEAERVLQVVADAMILYIWRRMDRGMGSGLSSSGHDLCLMEANQEIIGFLPLTMLSSCYNYHCIYNVVFLL